MEISDLRTSVKLWGVVFQVLLLFYFFPWTWRLEGACISFGLEFFTALLFLFFQPPSKLLLKDHKPQLGSPALKQTVHTQSAECNNGVMRPRSDWWPLTQPYWENNFITASLTWQGPGSRFGCFLTWPNNLHIIGTSHLETKDSTRHQLHARIEDSLFHMAKRYLHITFRCVLSVKQSFISCPLHWQPTLVRKNVYRDIFGN